LRESKILQAVQRLSQRNREKIFLVGGALRDLLLERPLGKDFDFVAPGKVTHLFPLLRGREVLGRLEMVLDQGDLPVVKDSISDIKEKFEDE
jgi:tRNA nucleotidyltransferase/poly(A) polymerase